MTTATADIQTKVEAPQSGVSPEDAVDQRKLIIFSVMIVGMFMAILDIQIVAASLPQIQAGLAASNDEISWVQSAYLIAEVMMIPASGYLSRALSTRTLFCISVGGFTLASFGCALAWNMPSLIVMRAIQGFVGGATIPTVFALAFSQFPRRMHGPLSAAIGLIVTLAPTIGPTLGGWISEHLTWHWLFLVNIPPGLLIVTIVWLYGHFDEPDFSLIRRLDVIGFALMAVALGLIEYVLEEGSSNDWFDDPWITLFSIIAAVSFVAFVWRSLTWSNPIVDLTAYKNRNFVLGSIATLVMGAVLFGLVYLLPLFLARVRGFSSMQVGETLFVTGAAMFLTAPVAGMTSRSIDPRYVAAFGLLLVAISTHAMTKLTADWGYWQLFWPQVGRGMGMMLTMAPLNVIVLGTLEPSQVRSSSGLYNLTRNLGGALGLAAINTELTNRTHFHARVLFDHINAGRAIVADRIDTLTGAFAGAGVPDAQNAAVKVIGDEVARQAAVLAYADSLQILFWISLIAAVMLLFVKPPKFAPTGGH